MRIRLLRIEAELLALLVLNAISNPSLPAIFALAYFLLGAAVCYLGGPKFFAYGALTSFTALFIWWRYVRELNPVHDKPLREPLSSFPLLEAEVRTVCSEFRVPLPRNIVFLLSPWRWQPFGCGEESTRSPRRELALPIGCLEIWSIFELRCYVAHTLVRRRPPRWLFHALQWSFTEPGIPQTRKLRLNVLMLGWRMMADMEADRRVAGKYGSPLVTRYIQQTLLVNKAIYDCLQRIIEPITRGGVLLPVASSCRAYHTLFEPAWVDHVNQNGVPPNPILLRLSSLPRARGSVQVHDSRPSVNLFGDIAALEERVVRNELKWPARRPLRRGSSEEIGELLFLPASQAILRQNASLLSGHTVHDLPNLARDVPQLAATVRARPGTLPSPPQREERALLLLSLFFAVELRSRAGCTLKFDIQHGVVLMRGDTTIIPGLIVKSLQSGEMTAEAYRKMLQDMGIP